MDSPRRVGVSRQCTQSFEISEFLLFSRVASFHTVTRFIPIVLKYQASILFYYISIREIITALPSNLLKSSDPCSKRNAHRFEYTTFPSNQVEILSREKPKNKPHPSVLPAEVRTHPSATYCNRFPGTKRTSNRLAEHPCNFTSAILNHSTRKRVDIQTISILFFYLLHVPRGTLTAVVSLIVIAYFLWHPSTNKRPSCIRQSHRHRHRYLPHQHNRYRSIVLRHPASILDLANIPPLFNNALDSQSCTT